MQVRIQIVLPLIAVVVLQSNAYREPLRADEWSTPRAEPPIRTIGELAEVHPMPIIRQRNSGISQPRTAAGPRTRQQPRRISSRQSLATLYRFPVKQVSAPVQEKRVTGEAVTPESNTPQPYAPLPTADPMFQQASQPVTPAAAPTSSSEPPGSRLPAVVRSPFVGDFEPDDDTPDKDVVDVNPFEDDLPIMELMERATAAAMSESLGPNKAAAMTEQVNPDDQAESLPRASDSESSRSEFAPTVADDIFTKRQPTNETASALIEPTNPFEAAAEDVQAEVSPFGTSNEAAFDMSEASNESTEPIDNPFAEFTDPPTTLDVSISPVSQTATIPALDKEFISTVEEPTHLATSPDVVPASAIIGVTTVDGAIGNLHSRLRQVECQLAGSQCPDQSLNVYEPLSVQVDYLQSKKAGYYGGVDVTFLQPRMSGAALRFIVASPDENLIESSYQSGLRYAIGYRDKEGLGVRGRYWRYDNEFEYVAAFFPAEMGIQLDVADGEFTVSQVFLNWNVELGAGARYAKLEYSTSAPEGPFGIGVLDYEGVGPTIAVDVRRQIGNTSVSLFGNLRGSWLIGKIRNDTLLLTGPRGTIDEEIMQVYENQLGLAWTRCLNDELDLEVRLAWESQYWINNALSDDAFGIGTNLAFTGPTVAAELRY